jgi:hypothetical protein
VLEGVRLQLDARSPSLLGIAMAGLAILRSRQDDGISAARLLGAWDRIKDEGAGAPPPLALNFFGDTEQQVRAMLGDEAFERAHAEGYAMTMEQARSYTAELAERLATGSPRRPG